LVTATPDDPDWELYQRSDDAEGVDEPFKPAVSVSQPARPTEGKHVNATAIPIAAMPLCCHPMTRLLQRDPSSPERANDTPKAAMKQAEVKGDTAITAVQNLRKPVHHLHSQT
jgi:hypothetical protein